MLKTWPKHFDAIWRGDKLFDMRYNDRDYAVGDTLHLKEWEPFSNYKVTRQGYFTGRSIVALVTYILSEDESENQPEFICDGWIVMSLNIEHLIQ